MTQPLEEWQQPLPNTECINKKTKLKPILSTPLETTPSSGMDITDITSQLRRITA
jgi:hypothetical protein